ncbi:hypothetical protein BEL04_13610 [Mucilaginibacter sp. PPCGB 2223]|uniref:lipase family protein n=1 Tax=Mucilaginibacter sp. PPCGB 2223 TaxID=1886027 RepID=UPI0008243E8F|nr:hypothetical protein [Mucilaginibacter sp. PPCGB 2223]OCX52494.1 hypothetical protein BEL04_13610 [Mucilaginibacter sp. PPCGB 2223]
MSNPKFNFIQQVFALNMFSNFASAPRKGSPAQLQKDLTLILQAILSDTNVQQMMGKWEVVWGPVVGSYGEDVKNQVASNAMYVAKNPEGQYVVAVSATNPSSLYGWFTEDFDVRTMVAWDGSPTPKPDAPRIANGTHLGLQHLLQLTYTSGPQAASTLMQFLNSTFGASAEHTQLVVSGHSLGGALSPVLALHIDEAQAEWNPAKTVEVSTMPTAGASPGNKAFSDYQNAKMGSRTIRFWNSLDPVPHGWQPVTVELVPFLYYPYFKTGILFKAIAGLVLEQSLQGTAPYPEGGFYTPLQPQVTPLPGQVYITLTRNLSGAQVLQYFVDMEAGKLLKKLGIGGVAATLIIDALNWLLNKFGNEESLDTLVANLEERIKKIPGYGPELDKFIGILYAMLLELENVMIFLLQLVYQHVTVYTDLMGTAQLHPLTQAIVNNLVSNGTIGSDYSNINDKLTEPLQLLMQTAPKMGSVIEGLLTDDLMAKAGWGKPGK